MTRRLGRTTVAAALAASALALAVPAPAVGAEQACADNIVPESEVADGDDTELNPVHDRMHVADAHELARGRGVTVAVIDSGVEPAEGLTEVGQYIANGTGVTKSGHGTIVAGLIAGKDGTAPAATIYDVKVFDAESVDATEGEKQVSSNGIAAGIRHVLDVLRTQRIEVVNISLAVDDTDPVLEAAVADLVAEDVVVVASAGNALPQDENFKGTAGSDDEVYPADYPGVLAVSALAPEGDSPAGYVTPNKDTDVAAPTVGAVSVNANGPRCVVGQVATSWAAAEVSGIVALLREHFPRDTPRQTIARLEATAEGAGALAGKKADNPWTGAGVVQAHDALTREIQPRRNGRLDVSEEKIGADAQAPPPPPDIDLFGTSRALLLWTGLLAGALLALAFMLRPLIRR